MQIQVIHTNPVATVRKHDCWQHLKRLVRPMYYLTISCTKECFYGLCCFALQCPLLVLELPPHLSLGYLESWKSSVRKG